VNRLYSRIESKKLKMSDFGSLDSTTSENGMANLNEATSATCDGVDEPFPEEPAALSRALTSTSATGGDEDGDNDDDNADDQGSGNGEDDQDSPIPKNMNSTLNNCTQQAVPPPAATTVDIGAFIGNGAPFGNAVAASSGPANGASPVSPTPFHPSNAHGPAPANPYLTSGLPVMQQGPPIPFQFPNPFLMAGANNQAFLAGLNPALFQQPSFANTVMQQQQGNANFNLVNMNEMNNNNCNNTNAANLLRTALFMQNGAAFFQGGIAPQMVGFPAMILSNGNFVNNIPMAAATPAMMNQSINNGGTSSTHGAGSGTINVNNSGAPCAGIGSLTAGNAVGTVVPVNATTGTIQESGSNIINNQSNGMNEQGFAALQQVVQMLPSALPQTINASAVPEGQKQQQRAAIPLYLDHDENCLTAYQCFLRKQIELFEAGPDELQGTAQGRNTPLHPGQGMYDHMSKAIY
jgi:hypothetical protein